MAGPEKGRPLTARALACPLGLVLGDGPLALRVTDAWGRRVCCVYGGGFDPHNVTVYGGDDLNEVRFRIRDSSLDRGRFLEDLGRHKRPLKDLTGPRLDPARVGLSSPTSRAPDHIVTGPDGDRMGTLASAPDVWEVIRHGAYEVTDAAGRTMGSIYRHDPSQPSRAIEVRGRTVMRLRRRGYSGRGYELWKVAGVPAHEEELLFAGVISVVLDEWCRGGSP